MNVPSQKYRWNLQLYKLGRWSSFGDGTWPNDSERDTRQTFRIVHLVATAQYTDNLQHSDRKILVGQVKLPNKKDAQTVTSLSSSPDVFGDAF